MEDNYKEMELSGHSWAVAQMDLHHQGQDAQDFFNLKPGQIPARREKVGKKLQATERC